MPWPQGHGHLACRHERDYVLLVWPGSTPGVDDPVVHSAIVRSESGEPYSRIVPGLSRTSRARLFEVLLTDNLDASVESYYISKPLPDPLLQQVPDVATRVAGPLFAAGDKLVGQPKPS